MITVVGNLKGGSGKSTVAFNLAVWLAQHKKTVNVFDLDPQQTLTDVVDVRAEEGHMPLFTVHHGSDALEEALCSHKGEVIVDVGTSDMVSMRCALSLARRVIIPVAPSQADVWSTQRFVSLIKKIFSERTEAIDTKVFVFVNRADTHHSILESDEAEDALKELEGTRLITSRLHQRTAYRRSFSEGLAVFEESNSSKASKEFKKFVAHLYPKLK
ncbi:MAG: AAA family ATPase [Gammaproteobacteria bacterium]|nr:AAA family ATPase [Gammaproteobacteria bacterium]